MNNVVLKSLSAENFVAFADKVSFSTHIDSAKRDNTSGTFTVGDYSFNKVSFIYGANGSGKTYFCKIIKEIQRLISWSSLINSTAQFLSLPHFKGIDAPIKKFAFDETYANLPSKFSIELMLDNTVYFYEFSVMDKIILSEKLTKKFRRTETILERTSSSYKDIVLRSEFKEFEQMKHVVKEEALCLSVAAIVNNNLAKKLVTAIQNIQVVNMTAAKLNPTNSIDSFSEERISTYANILRKADPTIRTMHVLCSEEEVARQKIDTDDFENREVIAKKMTVGIETEHAVYKDGEETISKPIGLFADESLGTVKLFTILPYLYDVLEEGGILVVDEIENGLHLSLVREIIQLFLSEESNPHHAQLICTSHQPLLVDGDFRRDQVWITSKDSFGKSSLHRMSELKTSHAKTNLYKKIIENAFGCNPDKFFQDNI